MAIEDIKKELEQRFAEPLDEFYKRRIIFWNDEDGEFLDEVKSLTLSNAKYWYWKKVVYLLLRNCYPAMI